MKTAIILIFLCAQSLALASNHEFGLDQRDLPSQRLADGSWQTATKIEELVVEKESKNLIPVKEAFSMVYNNEFSEKEHNSVKHLTSRELRVPELNEEQMKKKAMPMNVFLVKKNQNYKNAKGQVISGVKYFLSDVLHDGWQKASDDEFNQLVKVTFIPARKIASGAVVLPRWKLEVVNK